MKTLKDLLKNKKGEGLIDFAVAGVVGFVVLAVILYVMFPILGGVRDATTPANATLAWGATLNNSQVLATGEIASGATLLGIAEIVVPAVIILGVLMIGLMRKK